MSTEMQIVSEPRTNFLYVTATGTITSENAAKAITGIFDQASRESLSKILFDGWLVEGTISTLQRYDIGVLIAKTIHDYFSVNDKFLTHLAIVLQDGVIDNSKFGETVARNRGVPLVVTNSIAEAFRFIEEEPLSDESK